MTSKQSEKKVPLQGWFTEQEATSVRLHCARQGLAIGEFLRQAAMGALVRRKRGKNANQNQ